MDVGRQSELVVNQCEIPAVRLQAQIFGIFGDGERNALFELRSTGILKSIDTSGMTTIDFGVVSISVARDGTLTDLEKDTKELMADAKTRVKRTEATKKIQAVRKEAYEKITRTLTSDQARVWKQLAGEKLAALAFELTTPTRWLCCGYSCCTSV